MCGGERDFKGIHVSPIDFPFVYDMNTTRRPGIKGVSTATRTMKLVGHQVGSLKGEKVRTGDWLHRPFNHFKRTPYMQTLAIQWVVGIVVTFFVTLGSLVTGAMSGPASIHTIPTVAIVAVLVATIHYWAYAMIYHVRVPAFFLANLNPLITLAEMAHFQYGLIPGLVQMFGQALGHAAAGGLVYGIIKSASGGASFLDNTGIAAAIVPTATSAGWAFFIQAAVTFFWAWFYFHNYNHRVREVVFQKEGDLYGRNADSRDFPQSLAMIKAISVAITFPIMGITTQNPFRWLTGCILVSQCGISGVWAVPVGPVLGVALGWMVHHLTWTLTGPAAGGKTKFE